MKTIISVSASRNLDNSYLDYTFGESRHWKDWHFKMRLKSSWSKNQWPNIVCSSPGLSNPSLIPEHDFLWLFCDITMGCFRSRVWDGLTSDSQSNVIQELQLILVKIPFLWVFMSKHTHSLSMLFVLTLTFLLPMSPSLCLSVFLSKIKWIGYI